MTDEETTPMKQTAIYLPGYMLDWLKSQPAGMAETIRSLVVIEMGKPSTQPTITTNQPTA